MLKGIRDFAIGCFASLCAVFVPRMITMLGDSNGNMQVFNMKYIILGISFAAIIGVITAIFEYSKIKHPAETFMTALGIPAILAGALNTGTTGSELHLLDAKNQQLINTIAQKKGIHVEDEPAAIQLLSATPANNLSRGFSIIPSAYAQDELPEKEQDEDLRLGIRLEQKPYVIVLEKTNDKAKADQQLETLRKIIPQAALIKSGESYMVIEDIKPRDKSDAMLKAIELQDKNHLEPSLLQIKQ